MKRALIWVAILLILGGVTNCKAGPSKRLAGAELAADAVINSLCDIREAGRINDADWDTILEGIDAVHAAIKDMRVSVDEGKGDFETAYGAFQKALGALKDEEASR